MSWTQCFTVVRVQVQREKGVCPVRGCGAMLCLLATGGRRIDGVALEFEISRPSARPLPLLFPPPLQRCGLFLALCSFFRPLDSESEQPPTVLKTRHARGVSMAPSNCPDVRVLQALRLPTQTRNSKQQQQRQPSPSPHATPSSAHFVQYQPAAGNWRLATPGKSQSVLARPSARSRRVKTKVFVSAPYCMCQCTVNV